MEEILQKIDDLTKYKNQSKYNALEEFILDNQKTMAYLNGRFYRNSKEIMIKIPLENDFTQLYLGDANDVFRSKDLKLCGILDETNSVIFNTSSELHGHFGDYYAIHEQYKFKKIKFIAKDELNSIKLEIQRDLDSMLKIYAREHENTLKSAAKSKFQNQDNYYFNYWKEKTMESFIQNGNIDNAKQSLEPTLNVVKELLETKEWKNNQIISDYFRDKNGCLNAKFSEYIQLEEAKVDVGQSLLVKDFCLDILDEINKNESHKYDLIHRKRELFSILNEHPAVMVKVCIEYNHKLFTFKFERKDLCRRIGMWEYDNISSWGKSYEELHTYLKQNKPIVENRYQDTNFDIMSIKEISYRKEVLFKSKNSLEQKKDKKINSISREEYYR